MNDIITLPKLNQSIVQSNSDFMNALSKKRTEIKGGKK
jgi:hypothetical protein